MSVFVSEEECPAADGQADQERREKKSSVTFFGDRSRSHGTVTGSVGGGFLDRLVICFGGSGCGVVSWVGSFLAFVLSAVLELVSAGRTDGVSFALVWMEDFSGATVPGGISAAAGTGVPTACPTAFMIFGS